MAVIRNHFIVLVGVILALTPTVVAWMPTLKYLRQSSPSVVGVQKKTQLTAQQKNDDVSDAKYSGYNVLGTELSCCCSNVGGTGIGTGFYR